jgi:hypothetical protein
LEWRRYAATIRNVLQSLPTVDDSAGVPARRFLLRSRRRASAIAPGDPRSVEKGAHTSEV